MSNTTALRIVGFTRGPIFRGFTPQEQLTVRWLPPADAPVRVQVTAVAGRTCYRMDAAQRPAASTFAWSGRVLSEVGVHPSDLSAFAWTTAQSGGKARQALVPVEPVRASAANQPFTVTVLPNRSYKELFVTLALVEGERALISDAPLGRLYYPRNRPIMVDLPPDLPRGALMRLRIVGTYDGGANSTEVFLLIPR